MALCCNKQKPRVRWSPVKGVASYSFNIDIREKLVKVNFIATLIDRTTDRAAKEQEVFYVMYVDPETHKPNLSLK